MNQTLSPQDHAGPNARYFAVLVGSLFLLGFYWRGLSTWFYQDDFGWLHLGPATDFGDLLAILFAPKAHGNIRPWSENLFFFGLKGIFGVNPLPFRIVVFLTAILDIALLSALVRKLTGSALASASAPVLWLANAAVAPALCWTSIYNQSQYLVFVLLALLLFVKGKYWQQMIVFALGLGSLETAVMYPAIALAYALLYDRAKLRRTAPLFAISAAYTVLHFWAATPAKSGPYAIRIDGRIFQTLATYVARVAWSRTIGPFPLGLACLADLRSHGSDWRWRRDRDFCGRARGWFGLAWFLALLVPMLPLPEHVEDYALTGPAMGLAMILAGALAIRPRVIAPITVLYLAISLPAAWEVTSWQVDHSHMAGDLVNGVVAYDRAHPGKMLLITGLNTEQFYAGFADRPFETFGLQNVFLAPGAAAKVEDSRGWLPQYELPPATVKALLNAGKAAVLDVSGDGVRDVTAQFSIPAVSN